MDKTEEHEYWHSPTSLQLKPEELDDDIPVMPSFDQVSSLARVAREGLRLADNSLSASEQDAERSAHVARLAQLRRLL